jgi:hemerythrin-like domain-containing protein
VSKKILNHLRNEHLNINSLLRILERQLESIRIGDRPDYFLMHDIARYLTYFSDHYHHPFEDMIYTRLADKHQKFLTIVSEIGRQHHQIALKGTELRELIGGIIKGSIISRETIFGDGSGYINIYRSHMQTEEEELFGPLSANLTPGDWEDLISTFQWRPDPINADDVSREYQNLKEYITSEGAGEWPWRECSINSCPVCSNV